MRITNVFLKSWRPFVAALLLPATLPAADRANWTTSRIRGTPEPPKPFISERVFSNIKLTDVLDMVAVPGLNQWLFVENGGKIWAVPDDIGTAQAAVAIDIKAAHPRSDHAYAVAFHPRFAQNKQVFITYTDGDQLENGSHLSRFKVVQDNPLKIDPASEEILLTWLSGGHNGAAIRFGPDGFLYLSTGDAEVPNPPDPRNTGQNLDDLLSCILRLDVDRADKGKKYAVPQDNPFVSTPGARPEIWAYGLRNPWKMNFDKPTGRLWCGDVGWQQWENIFLITRGGNYGWSCMEGNYSLMPGRKGPTPITPPVVTHAHNESASITGGYVYHGKRLPELRGAYIYGDFETGKIWALWHDGRQVTRHEEIATTSQKIVSFGQDDAGELYHVHFGKPGTVHRLVRNPNAGRSTDFPRKLSEAGLFSDVKRQLPAPGVHPFEIRAPMWADGARGERFIGLPEGAVQTRLQLNKDGQVVSSRVSWPTNAVLAKTLSMEMQRGNAASAKKIETQVLHYDGYAWNAYAYRWNDAGTDADLVGPNGDERKLDLAGAEFPGGKHRYTHRIHSRAECLRCHNSWNGFNISVQPQQLGEADTRSLMALGVLDASFPRGNATRLVNPHDEQQPLEARARSWLHANCAHCHRTHAGGSVPVTLNAETPRADMHLVDDSPVRGSFGMSDTRIIMSGNPWRSALLHRVATTGADHMPAIGAREVDEAGLKLLADWARSLKPATALPAATPAKAAIEPDAALSMVVTHRAHAPAEFQDAVKLAATSPNAHIRGLFERFLPDEQRVETLGVNVTAEKITARKGDAKRGAELFSATGKAAACLACHFLNGSGRDFGPNLSGVGARLNRAQIIESIILPSKLIVPGFQAVNVTLNDGDIQTGFVVKREGDVVMLKIATGQTVPLKRSDMKAEQAQSMSLMPEGLLQSFTAQEAADLVEHLSTLK
ncbi:MAG: PQQ-dependent sugar dehydrogenase [Limisphaerales bacterium]